MPKMSREDQLKAAATLQRLKFRHDVAEALKARKAKLAAKPVRKTRLQEVAENLFDPKACLTSTGKVGPGPHPDPDAELPSCLRWTDNRY